ncbi:thioredoxin-dependent thiol peroxidase [Halobaculum marinum]|uniref:thioredoxin-dependent peroxiredoxin n=1 Tax=Halobaculum marinum TaxID=3031996 RepID=A0ABD5WYV5_9EURY|nr:thioredoxin-dependent thiol peroxidase [Halobaculum sp. DT55]
MLDTGTEAPGFSLPDHVGREVSLDEFDGKRVVLYFYPRADTPGCTTEACGFRDAHDEFEARDTVILGVSDDPVDDLTAFARKHDLPFRLLSDEDGEVSAAYDSYGEKNVFGNVVEGVFRNTYLIGPDRTIERVYEGVSPEDHADELLADIDDLREE